MSLGDENDGYEGGVGGAGQTRTRFPESTGDAYGGRRPAARGSRSLITVVGVVVLLIAAIAFANRGGGEGAETGTGESKNPGVAPTAATGVTPVGKGWAKDEQGAQSAASNYAVLLGSDGMFKAEPRREIVEKVHDPAVVGGLLQELDSAYSPSFLATVGLDPDGTAPEGMTFVSRTIPVGSKVKSFQGDSATVEVWCTGLVGLAGEGSTKPVSSTWFTITENLKWVDNGWKISKSEQASGPTPVNMDNRASSADDIADAIKEFGGFTYAR